MVRRVSRYLIPACAGFVVVLLCLFVRVSDPAPLENARERFFDFYQRIDPPTIGTDVPVRIVDIDDRSLAALGQWPWPRDQLGEMLSALHAAGAAVVAFDMTFPEPDRSSPQRVLDDLDIPAEVRRQLNAALANSGDNDEAFAQAIAAGPTVLGLTPSSNPSDFSPSAGLATLGPPPLAALLNASGVLDNVPVLQQAADGLGGIHVSLFDDDAVVRRIPAFIAIGDNLLPSLFAEALRVAQGEQSIILRTNPSSNNPDIGIPEIARIGAFDVPLTPTGAYRVLYGQLDPALTISAVDVFQSAGTPGDLSSRVDGTIVLVGTSAPGLFDLRASPLGSFIPGVTIHAQALVGVLTGAGLARPDWAVGLEIVAIALVGCLALALALFAPPALGAFITAVVIGLVGYGSVWAFSNPQMLIDASAPAVTAILTFVAVTVPRLLLTERQQRFIRNAFTFYLAEPVLARLERDPDALSLRGERRVLTVLFMDVRGFTARSESMAPTNAVDLLNALLDPLSEAVLAEEGTIDKFMGDGMMAFWNAPLDQPDHAERAIRAGKAMVAVVDDTNKRLQLDPPLSIGVGLNTGDAFVGNMGSKRRFAYSAIGDTVNLAARVEGLTSMTGAPLLITEATRAHAQQDGEGPANEQALVFAGEHKVKGRQKAVRVYRMFDEALDA
ncbi:MAG: adenylate/guanylate cyclase domain-containing protein [Pseudomonadota bacterium]